jgi:glycosyltransferase involved in cell wall biosynthesis
MENVRYMQKNAAEKGPVSAPVFSVVIPALNEEDGIAAIVERVLAIRPALAKIGIDGPELIVVDDGSRDRTAAIVEGYSAVKLVRHAVNRGYGAALKTGLAKSTGELIAFLDADGTYPPEYFTALCQAVQKGTDLAIGSRMSGAKSEMPLTRRIGNRVFAGLITLLSSSQVNDCASGMRVIRRSALPQLYPLPDGLNFTPIMSLRAIHEGLKVVEVPIPYHERVGRSKLSVVKDGLRYFQSITWTAMGYNPVRVLGGVGLAGILVALLVGLGLVVARFAYNIQTLGPWGVAAVFLALVAGVSGVSLFNLGATFNYLVSLFRKQPVREGLFGKPIFNPPLDRQFGWIGLLLSGAGLALAVVSLILGIGGQDISRLWLYLLGSAMLVLVGLQLVISWFLMRKLEELSEREVQTKTDLEGGHSPAPAAARRRTADAG